MAHHSGMLFSIIDSRMGSYPSECVERFVGLALKCCEDKPEDRPSILDVVRELENLLHILPEIDSELLESASEYPSKAASFSYLSSTSSTYATNNPYGSSASNLTSGAISTLTPRWLWLPPWFNFSSFLLISYVKVVISVLFFMFDYTPLPCMYCNLLIVKWGLWMYALDKLMYITWVFCQSFRK